MTDQQRNYLGQTAYQTYCVGASIMRSDCPLGSLPRWDDLSECQREELRAYGVATWDETWKGFPVEYAPMVRNVSGSIVPCVFNNTPHPFVQWDYPMGSESTILSRVAAGRLESDVDIHDATAETVGFDEELTRLEQAEPLFVIDDTDPTQGNGNG
jgi:hypothetical protein